MNKAQTTSKSLLFPKDPRVVNEIIIKVAFFRNGGRDRDRRPYMNHREGTNLGRREADDKIMQRERAKEPRRGRPSPNPHPPAERSQPGAYKEPLRRRPPVAAAR
ncbi:hypothetical protein B296_00019071 [Ensete ventricosum]|uniref:Uncharacterized protein n=1 Tax=Ensete ventricosum TaxID=4639 RepID=A0A426ZU39_ENSVE|nr:hypothetical protein B296_00019071 [Ensete ventricosum]